MEDGGKLPSESGALNKIEPVTWRGIRLVEKLILIGLPLLAASVLVLPFLDQVYLRRLSRLLGARPLITWLANGFYTWIIGAGLLLLWAAILLLVRQRLVGNKRLWAGNGCPNCMERELVRVSRKPSDRFYVLAAIPAYRYACRNCTWRGLRIARREYTPEREAELEEALARFQPDGAAGFNPVARDGTENTLTSSTPAVSGPSSIFRDAGDISWTEDPAAPTQIDDQEEPLEEPNHEANAEPLDAMEWLWQRSSDT